MNEITVTNDSGQTSSFGVTGPNDPRAVVLEQRIARGELRRGDQSKDGAVVLSDTLYEGVKDEEGNYLRSVHGGGIDPDAAGDARGVPSGSGADAVAGAKVALEAISLMEKNAGDAGLDATTEAVKVSVEATAKKSK